MARAPAKYKREDAGTTEDPGRRADAPRVAHSEDPRERAREVIAAAITDGSHGPGCGHFCTGCRELVEAIVWGDAMSSAELCAACYDKIKTAPIARVSYVKAKTVKVYQPTFEDALLWWAKDHFQTAFKAFADSSAKDWEERVLASIVRRRAQEEKGWLNAIIDGKWFSELYKLAGKVVKAGGYPILPGQTFADAIRIVRECPI